jgi:methionyl-tRNA synthetase
MAFYVTTPIYYVNAAPHLGHAYTTIGADVLARHMRQRGEKVFFLTGTDEHGEPVAQAAAEQGISPKELADRNAERFEALMPQIDVTNDFFIRTSDERHKSRVQEVMQRIHDNGHTYKGAYEGWYCPRCADFKTETEIAEGNTCPIHKIPLDRESEENWFFRLSSFQEPLERLYAENPEFVKPRVRFNEANAFIKGGLQDVSLSRSKRKLTWGVEVPWDGEHVFYVWFDALLNYYTALSFARDGEDLTERFWPAYHFLGKDILKFHSVFWPAMLLAADIELPKGEFIHGYLLAPPVEDAEGEPEKMGKSRGNTIDPFAIIERYGSDALRFYLLRDVTFGQDGQVSLDQFESRYESELANDYGNLASRTLNMLNRFGGAVVPDAEVDEAVGADFAGVAEEVARQLDTVELSAALETIWLRVRRLNRYVEEQAPWKLAKEPERSDHLKVVLRTLAEGLRVITVLLHAYMPQKTHTILAALGDESLDLARAELGAGERGQAVGTLEPLFPRAAK